MKMPLSSGFGPQQDEFLCVQVKGAMRFSRSADKIIDSDPVSQGSQHAVTFEKFFQ